MYGSHLQNSSAFAPAADFSSAFGSVVFTQVCGYVKKQSMQWTKRGAHLLLQARIKTLNNELGATFRHWYPDLRVEESALAA